MRNSNYCYVAYFDIVLGKNCLRIFSNEKDLKVYVNKVNHNPSLIIVDMKTNISHFYVDTFLIQ